MISANRLYGILERALHFFYPAVIILSTILVAVTGQTAESALAETNPKLILVTGVTGKQGGAVARELLRRGYRVRGLTRNTNSARALSLTALGVELTQGDFEKTDTISAALEGAYGAFSVQNYWEHGKTAEIRQGVRFADAAKAAGVTHLVYSSVAHANESTGIAHFDSKYEIEEHIRSNGLPYTIFRPVSFMENWEYVRNDITAGHLTTPFSNQTIRQQISVKDIGRFVGEALDNPDNWQGVSLDIAGDEFSMAEAQDIMQRVIGRPVIYQRITWTDHLKKEGEDMAKMDRWIQQTGYHVDLKLMRQIMPGLTSLEEYLHEKGWGNAGD
jgi:uncharacterized protein YbjT (DUF2867 family)